jgi:hypothetical protein
LPSDPIKLPDDLHLTQYGERPPIGDGFRDRLRESIGETEISMILGQVDAAAAAILVTRYFALGAMSRVTTAGRLRAADFRVVHSPTKSNRLHVSVFPPLTEAGEPAEWSDELASHFNACFTRDEED